MDSASGTAQSSASVGAVHMAQPAEHDSAKRMLSPQLSTPTARVYVRSTPKQHDKRPQSRIPLMVVSTSNTNQLDVAIKTYRQCK